ncbi:MAG TPA: PAS domain-containing protein [Pseudonocardiaceae bacterium]|nr:PAS domain-containing protein [Pseudonocardiaceae bacterium]
MTAAHPPQPGMALAGLAQAWADVTGPALPMSQEQVKQLLADLAAKLATAAATTPVDQKAVAGVAEELVAQGMTGPSGIGQSIEILAERLPQVAQLRGIPDRDTAVRQVVASLASGYAEALRRRTLAQQELGAKALLIAKEQAELDLRICEIRFREIFVTSGVGIVISTFEGMVVAANPAFADLVGRNPRPTASSPVVS